MTRDTDRGARGGRGKDGLKASQRGSDPHASDPRGKGGKEQRASHVPERARASAPDDGRPARVAARVRAELSEILLRGELRDPAATKAIVSSVVVTRDMSLVKIGLRALDSETKPAERERIVAAFQRAAGFLRTRIGKSLAIRQSPELRFAWDVGIDHVARVEALLREDDAPKGEEP